MDKHNTPEIWGGIECSYTRVQDCYGDQLDFCGHYKRGIQDIEAIAQIGFRSLRYPIIWEKSRDCPNIEVYWASLERHLSALRYHNINPIGGLVHHGSGPVDADLTDPRFADELRKYSSTVAEKFPELEYYTPINEPLTTARFCGLYGFWYPHEKNARAFTQILLNEIKATVISMKAIRQINPHAKLIQTEDLGKIYSTPNLKYQADFENERRWLTFDLLCGTVKPGHPMWEYFTWLRIPERELYFFVDNPFPPAILGLDYYLTSERFLDDEIDKYPPHTHGSNDNHQYADVEAIRVKFDEPSGPSVLLKECWDRYNIPMAVTEVHVHGTPNDQIRWFHYIWKTCVNLKNQGIDIKAVTSWAMFGSFGWSSLLTTNPGEYECGVFDIRPGYPAPTDYTDFLRRLSRDPNTSHIALSEKGWWESEERFHYRHLEEPSRQFNWPNRKTG